MPSFPIFPGFSALDSLSLSTDGPISPAQYAEARAHDAAHPLNPPPAARLGNIRLKPAEAAARMAVAIEQAACRSGLVTRDDFRLWGFTESEIDAHALPAYRQAVANRPALEQLLAV